MWKDYRSDSNFIHSMDIEEQLIEENHEVEVSSSSDRRRCCVMICVGMIVLSLILIASLV